MIPLLRSRPEMTVKELVRELGASRKEILADLNRIFLCGVPPYLPHDYILVSNDDDRVSIDFADHFARPVRLTLREALALKLAIRTLPPLSKEMTDAAEALLEVVEDLLQKDKQERSCKLENLNGRIQIPGSRSLLNRLQELQVILAQKREIKMAYYSASSSTLRERWIRPYALIDQGGNYYLVSYCLESREQRSFRVDRIQKILDRNGPHFTLPESFSPRAACEAIGLSGDSGILIRARFAPRISPWIREDYKDQCFELEDGSILVEFRAGSVPWAVQKLLGYGELVEVLEPETVKDELIRRLREIAA
jgi:proteasome accessory factor C